MSLFLKVIVVLWASCLLDRAKICVESASRPIAHKQTPGREGRRKWWKRMQDGSALRGMTFRRHWFFSSSLPQWHRQVVENALDLLTVGSCTYPRDSTPAAAIFCFKLDWTLEYGQVLSYQEATPRWTFLIWVDPVDSEKKIQDSNSKWANICSTFFS